MDGELVSDSPSDIEELNKGGGNAISSPFFHSKTFEAQFPYYLSIGMTEEQYWDKDSTLTKAYRDAEKIRIEKRNQEMWLQGMYIYDAMSRLVPIMNAFAKKGTRAKPYMEEPYPISEKTKKESENRKEKVKAQKGKLYMQKLMAQSEIHFKGKE